MRKSPAKRPLGRRRFRWATVTPTFLKGEGDDFVLVPDGNGFRPAKLLYLTDQPVSGGKAYDIVKDEYAGPLPV
jgi:hypothetical protein